MAAKKEAFEERIQELIKSGFTEDDALETATLEFYGSDPMGDYMGRNE
jgi:hypothetical protein